MKFNIALEITMLMKTKLALSRAVEKGNIEIIKLLMECPKIEPNIILKMNVYGKQSKYEEKTTLSIAIDIYNKEIIEISLSNEKTVPNSLIYGKTENKSELQGYNSTPITKSKN